MAHSNWNASNIPDKIKRVILKMKRGEIKNCHTTYGGNDAIVSKEAIKYIKDNFNYDITKSSIHHLSHILYSEKDIKRIAKCKKQKNWTSEEDELCKTLLQLLPSRASQDEWNKLVLVPMDKAFPIREHSKNGCGSRMNRIGFKRTGTHGAKPWQTWEYYAEVAKESGWELLDWEPGSSTWKVKHLACEHIQVKTNFGTPSGRHCKYCSNSFVGGLPVGPEPALVYLLDFEKVNKAKIGYAELGGLPPIQAIHRTSRGRYPKEFGSYKIVAYDLSTKTKAGKYEQDLLDDTVKNRVFIEPQEFTGHTEFRTRETIKQLKKEGEYKTWLK